jgi:hypothetical protein
MGEKSEKVLGRPFHEVMCGIYLANVAMYGWSFATGLGSMDAAALDQARSST